MKQDQPSSQSSQRPAIQQGAAIRILSKRQENLTDYWFQIANLNGDELGWIPIQYVIPSSSCPKEAISGG